MKPSLKHTSLTQCLVAVAMISMSISCQAKSHQQHLPAVTPIVDRQLTNLPLLGEVSHAGAGCPMDSKLDVVLSESDQSLALFPSQLIAETAAKGGGLDRKACSIVIPLSIPAGKALRLSNIRTAGSFDLSQDGTARINSEAFVAGARGPQVQVERTGAEAADLFDETNFADELQTPCGQDVNLRVNTSVLTSGSQSLSQVQLISAKVEMVNCQ